MSKENPQHETRLRIGAVSRLTGLSVHALRKWEERYGAVQPLRTPGGERLYSHQDVQRLALIKRLTQSGASLAEIARTPLPELEQIAVTMAPALAVNEEAAKEITSVRVGIVGVALPVLLQTGPRAVKGLEVVASAATSEGLQQQLQGQAIDVLVQEFPTLHGEATREVARSIRTLGANGAVVVYGFAARAALDSLRRSDVALLRAPIDLAELPQATLALMRQRRGTNGRPREDALTGAVIPAPRFSPELVARVAQSTPAMRCECPRHLADIIASLLAFERYSRECESRNTEDATLHHFLAVTTGRARCAFEEALERVAQAEGIDLDAP